LYTVINDFLSKVFNISFSADPIQWVFLFIIIAVAIFYGAP
jgi:hypothetical protein